MNVHLTFQVPRSADLDQNLIRLQQKLDHLLLAFQPELVQLQGRLVRHTSREGVDCKLNLHLPTAQLSSEETETTAQLALRAAGEDLIKQVQKHKARLRESRSQPQARIPREPAADRNHGANGGPPRGAGPPRAAETELASQAAARARRRGDLAGYFGTHHGEVLRFVRRQIQLREHLGEIPVGSLDPSEVLDEVVVAALEDRPQSEPISRGRWLMVLAAGAIRRLARTYGGVQHGQQLLALNSDPLAQDEPDPEQLASTSEMMDQLAQSLRSLPCPQRHDLALFLLEGFKPRELAHLSHRTPAEVESSLHAAEAALRAQPGLPASVRQHLRLGVERLRA